MKQTLSIIIPAYSEEKRIGRTLKALAKFVRSDLRDYTVEVVIVAADSSDDTVGVVREHASLFKGYKYTLLRPGPKVGKGRDVQYGMLRATGEYRIFMDADMATPLPHIIDAIAELRDGADIVMGVRDLRKIHSSLLRSALSQVGNILSKVTVNVYHTDTQCGFKAFTTRATKTCFKYQKVTGWGFDIEILAIAKIHELKVVELPIPDWQEMAGGSLNESVLKAASRTLKELSTIRININHRAYQSSAQSTDVYDTRNAEV